MGNSIPPGLPPKGSDRLKPVSQAVCFAKRFELKRGGVTFPVIVNKPLLGDPGGRAHLNLGLDIYDVPVFMALPDQPDEPIVIGAGNSADLSIIFANSPYIDLRHVLIQLQAQGRYSARNIATDPRLTIFFQRANRRMPLIAGETRGTILQAGDRIDFQLDPTGGYLGVGFVAATYVGIPETLPHFAASFDSDEVTADVPLPELGKNVASLIKKPVGPDQKPTFSNAWPNFNTTGSLLCLSEERACIPSSFELRPGSISQNRFSLATQVKIRGKEFKVEIIWIKDEENRTKVQVEVGYRDYGTKEKNLLLTEEIYPGASNYTLIINSQEFSIDLC